MASSDLILRTGVNQVTAEQLCEDGPSAAQGRGDPVANTTVTPNEKEAKKKSSERKPQMSGKENDCDRQPEDRQLLKLLELQKRMFQST